MLQNVPRLRPCQHRQKCRGALVLEAMCAMTRAVRTSYHCHRHVLHVLRVREYLRDHWYTFTVSTVYTDHQGIANSKAPITPAWTGSSRSCDASDRRRDTTLLQRRNAMRLSRGTLQLCTRDAWQRLERETSRYPRTTHTKQSHDHLRYAAAPTSYAAEDVRLTIRAISPTSHWCHASPLKARRWQAGYYGTGSSQASRESAVVCKPRMHARCKLTLPSHVLHLTCISSRPCCASAAARQAAYRSAIAASGRCAIQMPGRLCDRHVSEQTVDAAIDVRFA